MIANEEEEKSGDTKPLGLRWKLLKHPTIEYELPCEKRANTEPMDSHSMHSVRSGVCSGFFDHRARGDTLVHI